MDSAKSITHISLCTGYGGLDIGLKRAVQGLQTIAYSEIDAFACANLVAKIEADLLDVAPIWTNLKTFPWESFRGKVDILSGGYPCQPFSSAGKRNGQQDERHLWPFIAAGIDICKPAICFFENVEGHITLGLQDVINGLGERGYQTAWGIFSAAEVGAPHQRNRVFILAERYRKNECRSIAEILTTTTTTYAFPARPHEQQREYEPSRTVSYAKNLQCNANNIVSNDSRREISKFRVSSSARTNQSWQQDKPSLGRESYGPSNWLGNAELYQAVESFEDEMRMLGNGVVPMTAELAFRTLLQEIANRRAK